jgi:predicted transcriptional regulator of viral defense system/very-short-patch-repair endonuclease
MSLRADHKIAATAASQFGHLTWRQMRAAGLSEDQIRHRVRVGVLIRVYPGVYRVAAVPPSPHGAHMAAVLATGGVVSHRSAAWLLGLWDRPPGQIELTLPRPLGWRSDLVTHRLTDLRAHDVTEVDGIPCTDAARLLVDMGAVCRQGTVEKLFHKVLHQKRSDFDTIVSRFFQVARRGRAGAGVLRPILENHDPAIAPAESDLEVVLLRVLRSHGLPDPVRQYRVAVAGHRYRLDVCYPDLKLILEGDGFGVHTEEATFENDRFRQNRLLLGGWFMLRFTWKMLIHTPWTVAKDVFDARQLRLLGSNTGTGYR